MSTAPAGSGELGVRAVGFSLAFAAIFCWGFNFLVGRALGPDLHPVLLTFFRWLIAAACLLAFVHRLVARHWREILAHRALFLKISFVGMSVYMFTVYMALLYTPVVNASLINGSSPVVLLLLLAATKAERVRPVQVAGCLVAGVGLLCLLGEGRRWPWEIVAFNPGDFWALASALGWAGYMLLARQRPHGMPILVFHTVCVTLGTAYMLLPAVAYAALHGVPSLSAAQWSMVVYVGVVPSVFSYWCWNAAIHRLGAGTTGITYYILPPMAAVQSWVLLGEELGWHHFVSMALIISGVLLAEVRRKPKLVTGG